MTGGQWSVGAVRCWSGAAISGTTAPTPAFPPKAEQLETGQRLGVGETAFGAAVLLGQWSAAAVAAAAAAVVVVAAVAAFVRVAGPVAKLAASASTDAVVLVQFV